MSNIGPNGQQVENALPGEGDQVNANQVEQLIYNSGVQNVAEVRPEIESLFARADALVAQVQATVTPTPQIIDLMHGMIRKMHKDLTDRLQMEDLGLFNAVMTKLIKVDQATAKLENELVKRVSNRRAEAAPAAIIRRVLGDGNIVRPPPEWCVQEGEPERSPVLNRRESRQALDNPMVVPEANGEEPPELEALAPPPPSQAARPAASTSGRSVSTTASGRSVFSVTSVVNARKKTANNYGAEIGENNAVEYEQAKEIEEGVQISIPIGQSDLSELKRRSHSHLRPFDGKDLDWPAFWAEFRGEIYLNPKLTYLQERIRRVSN